MADIRWKARSEQHQMFNMAKMVEHMYDAHEFESGDQSEKKLRTDKLIELGRRRVSGKAVRRLCACTIIVIRMCSSLVT